MIDDDEREAPVSDSGKSQHVYRPIFSSAPWLSARDAAKVLQ